MSKLTFIDRIPFSLKTEIVFLLRKFEALKGLESFFENKQIQKLIVFNLKLFSQLLIKIVLVDSFRHNDFSVVALLVNVLVEIVFVELNKKQASGSSLFIKELVFVEEHK